MEKNEAASVPTAFLVDLVSNRKIPITTPRCRVGRDDLNDIVISGDQSISRFHFIITYEDGQYQVQDAKSRHGTFLNGNQIGGPEPINDGDVLKIGVSLFWFVIETQAGVEKDDGLPPVDVEKSKEEVSLKTGGEPAYAGSQELSATQEISIVSPEALQAAGLLYKEEEELAEAARENREKEEEARAREEAKKEAEKAEAEKAAEINAQKEKEKEAADAQDAPDADAPEATKTDVEDDESKVEEELKLDDDKVEEVKKSEEPKAEEEEPKAVEDQPQADSEPADEEKEELKATEEEQQDSKQEDEDSPNEPATAQKEEESGHSDHDADSNHSSKSGLLHTEEIQNAVKDLLEPLTSEIEASREMIRDALKKSELRDEEESSDGKDGKSEPDKASEDSDEAEPQAPDEGKEGEEPEEEEVEAEGKTKDEPPDEEIKPEETKKKDEKSPEAETLEKIAEIIDDSSPKTDLAEKGNDKPAISADKIQTTRPSDYDKATNGLDEDMTTVSQMGPATVPDWCKRYFSDELKHLNKELETLNDQIKQTQDMIKKIEGQAALTKGLRNTLLTADGDDLIDACKRVFGLAGWKVTQSDEDKHEFLLEHDDEKVAIARVISIKGTAERSHLGQLSISQTRYWCEKGVEPKGVLIVGRQSEKAPKERGADANEEVTEYASSKNVCLLNTLQLLAIYRDIALKDGKSHELRSSIHESKGWLKGLELEPGDDSPDDEDKESTKGKSLSSLLSA
ncbi:MAG: FHA domain-containing protein [Candidatus Obscuribacterales bacterium]|nr:FHA domain-containing protein [Candidatus Obscuribacterales bacterium]